MQVTFKTTRIVSQRPVKRIYSVPPTPHNSVQNCVTRNDISLAIKDAEESVKQGDVRMIAVKWDIVHELWTEYQHQEDRKNIYNKFDPMEAYCSVDMDALECREYDL